MGRTAGLTPASVGVVENANSAVLVTIALDGKVVDRRRVELTGSGLPTHPHHHEGSWAVGRYLKTPGARTISMPEAVALVERVREAAALGARKALEALEKDLPMPIGSIAIRACPELPATTEERIKDNRAQTYADSVMYRQAVAAAAQARGWAVYWYEREKVVGQAAAALGSLDLDSILREMGRSIGPPWKAEHKLAAAAAIAAAAGLVP